MPKVEIIPATKHPITHLPSLIVSKRRAAAYARVSTEKDEQFSSYEAQIDYYTNYIKSHTDWEFVKVYTDDGISGTSTKHRDGFKEMVEDALAGKIDLIITKSVSRFARNTVDSLSTIRKLKEAGVEMYFEKENIWTFDSKGELLITIMSSIAQEESRSISENVTWGKRRSAENGKVYVAYSRFLGYEKGENAGDPMVVNPEQAEIVKRIYREFMSGKTYHKIAEGLTKEGIPTPSGKKIWRPEVIDSILTNEKYKGCAILQKTYTADFLAGVVKKNEGEVPQYYVTDSHEAIIEPDEWQMVQNEIARRKLLGQRYSGKHIFATKIICGDCGGFYGSVVWHSNEKNRKIVWRCNRKYEKGKPKCTTMHLTEQEIKERFVAAFNALFDIKDEIIANGDEQLSRLCNSTTIDAEIAETLSEMEVISELTQKCIENNARSPQKQDEYLEQYNGYAERFEKLKQKHDELLTQRSLVLGRSNIFKQFMKHFKARETPLTEFDERVWQTLLESVTVMADDRLIFRFYNGSEIEG